MNQGRPALRGFGPSKIARLMVCILRYQWLMGCEDYVLCLVLAEESRKEAFRLLFFRHGVVDFFLDALIKEPSAPPWTVQALCLIGNCCVIEGANKDLVLKKMQFKRLFNMLKERYRALYAVVLLYNLCYDYEPAQNVAQSKNLTPRLIDLMNEAWFEELKASSQVYELLRLTLDKFDVNECRQNSIEVLCKASAVELDVDEIESLSLLIERILTKEEQRKFVLEGLSNRNPSPFMGLLDFFLSTFIDPAQNSDGAEGEDPHFDAKGALSRAIASIAQAPNFVQWYPLQSPEVRKLTTWLSSVQQKQLCALYFFNTLISSSETVRNGILFEPDVGSRLQKIIISEADPEVLYQSLEFLHNLGVVRRNRDKLGSEFRLFEALSARWTIKLEARGRPISWQSLHQTRQLLGSLLNVAHFLEHPTLVRDLLEVFQNPENNVIVGEETTRLHVGRTVAQLWRTNAAASSTNSVPDLGISSDIDLVFQEYPNIAEPLLELIKAENRSLSTEGWFAMVLMAKAGGGEVVYRTLCRDDSFAILKAVVKGQDLESKDRTNALQVVNELIFQNWENVERMAVLQPLLTQQ